MSPTATILAERYARDLTHWQAAGVLLDAIHDDAASEEDAEREWFAAVCASVRAQLLAIAAGIVGPRDRLPLAKPNMAFVVRAEAPGRGRVVPVSVLPGYRAPELCEIVNGQEVIWPLLPEMIRPALATLACPVAGVMLGQCRLLVGATRVIRMWHGAKLFADDDAA